MFVEAICDLKQRIPEIQNIFDIHNRIGNGTFSTVLLGTLIKERDLPDNKKRKFAIKHHVPTSHPDRIMKELQCMAKIGYINENMIIFKYIYIIILNTIGAQIMWLE